MNQNQSHYQINCYYHWDLKFNFIISKELAIYFIAAMIYFD